MLRILLFSLIAAGSLTAQPGRTPYLAGAAVPDMFQVLPEPPQIGSPRDDADRAIFKATRSFKGSPRWELAVNDAALGIAAILADFRCALGLNLTPQNAPQTAALLSGALRVSGGAIVQAKQKFQRKRPYLIDPVEADQLCTAKLADFDYPSGHTTAGWAMGLALAETAPDRASAILARARAFGESRVVCGMHNASAVDAGYLAGSALFGALLESDSFRADVEAARKELADLRRQDASLPEAAASQAESKLLGASPY